MAQRGVHLNWGRRGRRNVRRRGPIEEELLRRLETIESRLPPEESEEELEVSREWPRAANPMERLIEAITKQGTRVKVEVPDFKGDLNPNLFMDWIQELEKYFDMEGIEEMDPRRTKIVASRMKSHAALWWENLQNARKRQGKEKIKSWPKMLKRLNVKFMPADYQQRLFKEYQNLRQKELSISAFTEEFLKLQIRTGLQKDDEHAAARYVNGLRYQLQDELALLKVNSVDEAYQLALKAEEKLNRRGKAAFQRGSSSLNKGRGNYSRSTSEADSSME